MKSKELIFIVFILIMAGLVFYSGNKNNSPSNNIVNKTQDFTNNESKESDIVTEYVKQNIKSIATNQPVLGGSWYVVSVSVDPSLDSGSVVYEDGHIQSSASFEYEIYMDNVNINKFTILE